MQWRRMRKSENVEDRRGARPGLVVGGGLGTLVLVIAIWLLGGDPTTLFDAGPGSGAVDAGAPAGGAPPADDEQALFVSAVLGSTEDVWSELFARHGKAYEAPRLVLFENAVRSRCGLQSAAVGPFYCPADRRVYLDLDFFRDLARRHDAPGDFAQAYVVAHEVGHHVQHLLGTTDRVAREQATSGASGANELSVRLELQADYLAGVWAHHAQRDLSVLEPGDLEEALRAASQIGDDRLQMESQGYVAPDSFTHGTAEQRARWFRRGFESGDPDAGDTFSTSNL